MNFSKSTVNLIRVGRKQLARVGANTLLIWIVGFALGALTNIYPLHSLIVFGALSAVLLFIVVRDRVKAVQPSKLSEWENTLRQPDRYAAAHVARSNEHFLVVGQAIEVLPHPNLSTRATIDELGWDPAEVQVNDLQEQFNAEELLDKAGGYREFDPPNGIKFSLADTSFVTEDSPVLTLDLRSTNYFTLMSIMDTFTNNPDLRAEFGNLTPDSNRTPHSLCLHYIVRLSDGDCLCMRRHHKAAYHGGYWSFSGEEQLLESDLLSSYPMQSLFRRTFCEEVLALRDENPATLEDRWQVASQIVQNMRLWSIFVEEEIFTFTFLGMYQLNVNMQQFVSFHNELINRDMGNRDREGDFFIVSQSTLKNLLFNGQCNVKSLLADEILTIRAENLHPTSRYRIFRLLRAVYRRPLQPEM
jgi:hypothetical protein